MTAARGSERWTHFLASSFDISSRVRPLVSGTHRMTNTRSAKHMAEWKNMTFGTPTFSGNGRKKGRAGHLTCKHICFTRHVFTLLGFKYTKLTGMNVYYANVVSTPVTVRKVMEMSRLTAQFTAATTDAALPRTPIGKISLLTTYTTEKTADEGKQKQNVSGKSRVQTLGRNWFLKLCQAAAYLVRG